MEYTRGDDVIQNNPRHFKLLRFKKLQLHYMKDHPQHVVSHVTTTKLVNTICVSNVFINDLLVLLQKELLTNDNKMLTIVCEIFMLIKVLGLNYDSIHACTNYGCVLF